MIPNFLDEEALMLIDKLLQEANYNLQSVLEKIMPNRDGAPHWVFLMGCGLFVHNYQVARRKMELPIEEAFGYAVNFILENPEIQYHVAQIMTFGAHNFTMGGSQ